ncbi:N-methyl-L-tryptophan oxidase [Pontibacillus marinus]|uniref:Methyltryptophan oxidase n=1 Tax=Pontibacillus marinus BH030004 = DSM 16465 TaxID=1385511 RepID=A0A0A5GAG8_9BACI|nr:N-methyl-L-tryptophan oxidase [Pontibacillus marinus]KGX90171.1 methyltryptophan oxidase [Pontibacillus marinus BH030004 = DSM 16465]
MKDVYDVVIVGGGSMGMSAAYQTAKQGLSTLIIDKDDPPHDQGSHHGSTRAIRHAYGEGSAYVPLVLRAQELWEQLQKESGRKVFQRTGVLGIGDKDSAFVKETITSAQTYKLEHEILSSEEISNRWSGLKVPEHFIGCFEQKSGVLFSEEAIRAYRELAEKHGARLVKNTEVNKIDEDGGQPIKVQTSCGDYFGRKVIVTTGANLTLSIDLPIQPIRKTFAWYEGDETLFGHENFPAFFVEQHESTHYGMPSLNGEGVKIGRHDGGQPIHGKEELLSFGSYKQDKEELHSLVDQFFPSINKDTIQGKVCTYARTPDEDFIIDQHPRNKNLIIAGGFSGHGFKFSSVIGEILSDLVVKGESEFDLSMFSLGRFTEEN